MKLALALLASLALTTAATAQLQVTASTPALNASHVQPATAISVTFDRPVNPATFTSASFWAFGRWSGPVGAAITFSPDLRTATLTPTRPFFAGEVVTVLLSSALRGADNTALRPGGYTLQFTVRVTQSTGQFRRI